jgi:hypothetical protein
MHNSCQARKAIYLGKTLSAVRGFAAELESISLVLFSFRINELSGPENGYLSGPENGYIDPIGIRPIWLRQHSAAAPGGSDFDRSVLTALAGPGAEIRERRRHAIVPHLRRE